MTDTYDQDGIDDNNGNGNGNHVVVGTTPGWTGGDPPTGDMIESPEFLDALDEVHTRFLLNLPTEELSTSDRIFFQLEQAWWFYEDMICDQRDVDKTLPRFGNLKPFAKRMFEYSPLLDVSMFPSMYKEFTDYRGKISTYGCILLNDTATHVVLCQVWKGDLWTLPAGKINQGETGPQAAARETYEETGFDPHCCHGLTKEWKDDLTSASGTSTSTTNRRITWQYPLDEEKNAIAVVDAKTGKRRTCYVCVGVPMDYPFHPVARKEVERIDWFSLEDLPKKSFAVLPFMGKLRQWIRRQQNMNSTTRPSSTKKNKNNNNNNNNNSESRSKSRNKSTGRDKSSTKGRDHSSAKGRDPTPAAANAAGTTAIGGQDGRSNSSRRQSSRRQLFVVKQDDDPLVDAGLANVGDPNRWSEEDMFYVNEQLSGRKVEYDGNPHVFADQGFYGGVDPHAFRVVGGSFMNSGPDRPVGNDHDSDIDHDATTPRNLLPDLSRTTPQWEKYQPLVHTTTTTTTPAYNDNDNDDNDDAGLVAGLQPFFSQQGATPWGDVVAEARASAEMPILGRAGPNSGTKKTHRNKTTTNTINNNKKQTGAQDDPSQQLLSMLHSHGGEDAPTPTIPDVAESVMIEDEFAHLDVLTDAQITARKQAAHEREQRMVQQYEADKAYLDEWVRNLPNPIGFKIQNVDEIIHKHFGAAY